eukprot:6183230-Pleurochrysis_carterae.AAC.3
MAHSMRSVAAGATSAIARSSASGSNVGGTYSISSTKRMLAHEHVDHAPLLLRGQLLEDRAALDTDQAQRNEQRRVHLGRPVLAVCERSALGQVGHPTQNQCAGKKRRSGRGESGKQNDHNQEKCGLCSFGIA